MHNSQYRSDLAQKKYEERLRGKPKAVRFMEEVKSLVDEKVRFSDLELDTVIGRNHKGTIMTVNDRVMGLCWLAKLEGKESEPLKDALIRKLLSFKRLLKTVPPPL